MFEYLSINTDINIYESQSLLIYQTVHSQVSYSAVALYFTMVVHILQVLTLSGWEYPLDTIIKYFSKKKVFLFVIWVQMPYHSGCHFLCAYMNCYSEM